jgi:hypothetical protein
MGSSEDAAVGLRADLVALLTEQGSVSDPRVAAALGQVPRHVFVPAAELAEAYADEAIVTHQASPCILGPAGFAVLDLAGLVTAWDAAGRPGVDRLHIDAYPSGISPPADADPHTTQLPATRATLHPATHTTFAVRFGPAGVGAAAPP